MRVIFQTLALFACLFIGGCGASSLTIVAPNAHAPFTGYASTKYSDAKLWLCRPDLKNDVCHTDLRATEFRPDGTRAIVPFVPAEDPKVDCFYVYPTVDMGLFAYNHTDFDDVSKMATTTLAQVAHFREACALYVPLYRQISIGGYFWGPEEREKLLSVAFSDVLDAFLHYMGQYNHGRKIVLIGHSQGAEMLQRLMSRVFDDDASMRERLVVALPIGGDVEVDHGKKTGPRNPHIPICSRDGELACIVAFRSFHLGRPPHGWNAPDPGRDAVCVNPASEGSREPALLSRAYLPSGVEMRKVLRGIDEVTTPFILLRDFYKGQCVTQPNGDDYFGITEAHAPGDQRVGPFALDAPTLNEGHGFHVLDMQLAQGDLIDLVKRKASIAMAP